MDVLRPLVAKLTFPWYARRDGQDLARHQGALEASQWMSTEEIAAMQTDRLRALVDFAFRHNAFHRARMVNAGITPSDIRSAADLRLLPRLEKDDIRAAGTTMFSEGYSTANSLHARTGGSTGVPLHVYIDHQAMAQKYAATWRHNSWAGWRPGDKVAAIWGDTDKGYDLKAWLRFWFQHRSIYLDTLKFSEARLRAFHRRMCDYKPTVMMGHAHSVFQFAAFCREHDLRVPPLTGIVTTAMTLSETERQCIEQSLGSRVFNRYGCEELSIIASESDAHSGMHVFSEGLIIELLPTEVAGEHEFVVTDLLNRAMPMIRYAIGDVGQGASGSCPSGRGLDRLSRVSGRTADFLYRPDGTPVFGISLLDAYIIHIPGIRQAQMIQNAIDQIDIHIVPDSAFGPASVESIQQVVSKEFGAGVRCVVTVVSTLEPTARGKYRFSICNIDRPVAV